MATGTVTITHQNHKSVKKLVYDWTSTSVGTAGDITTEMINGRMVRVVHVPGTGGSQPSASFDVVINDSDGIDVLQGMGANISNAGPTDFFPALTNGTDGNAYYTAVDSKLTLAVTNAGDTKSGETIIYYE